MVLTKFSTQLNSHQWIVLSICLKMSQYKYIHWKLLSNCLIFKCISWVNNFSHLMDDDDQPTEKAFSCAAVIVREFLSIFFTHSCLFSHLNLLSFSAFSTLFNSAFNNQHSTFKTKLFLSFFFVSIVSILCWTTDRWLKLKENEKKLSSLLFQATAAQNDTRIYIRLILQGFGSLLCGIFQVTVAVFGLREHSAEFWSWRRWIKWN